MKRILLSLLTILLLGDFSFAQTNQLDSLKTTFTNHKIRDSIRFEAGLDAFTLLFKQNLDSARVMGNEVLKFAQIKESKQWEATAFRLIGNTYAVQGNYKEALKLFLNSHDLLKQISDEKGMSTTFNNIGTVFYELGDYPKALDYLLEGLKLAEKLNDKSSLARVTNNLGNVFIRQENNEKALEFYTYSLRIKEELGNKRTLTNAYNNIGLVYTNLGNYDKALQSLKTSALISNEIGDKMSLTRAYNNIGEVYNLQSNFTKSLEYLDLSIQIKKEIGDKEGLASAYLYRGRSYLYQKRHRLAIVDCELSLQLGEEMGVLIMTKEACNCISNAWEALGNTKKALYYYKLSVSAKDFLFNNEKTQEINRQELQYQYDKQQLADSIAFHRQKAEQELIFEKNLSKQRNKFNLIVFGGLGLLVLGGVYWNSRRKSIKLAQEREVIHKLKQVDQLKDQFLANTSH